MERIAPVEEPSVKKGKELAAKKAKAVPTALAPATTATPRVTKQSPAKKKLEVTPAKVFERKRKTKANEPDSKETESDEQPKKARQAKKVKKNEPATSTLVNIDISSYKPLKHCQRIVKNIRRKLLHDLIDFYDEFNSEEKDEVLQEIILYLCKNDWSPSEIKSQTPDSLFKALDNKW